MTHDEGGTGVAAGARFAISDHSELIGEISSRPVFIHVVPEPSNNLNFNLGLRLRPRQLPGLRVDLAAIADGRADFGFSVSYRF